MKSSAAGGRAAFNRGRITASGLLLVVTCVTGSADLVSAQSGRAGESAEHEEVRQRFVGHYELVRYEVFRANGEVVDMEYVGRIMYDQHGNMSAIGMPKNLPERARAADDNVQAGFAYWGTVSFDVDRGIVIHHVQGSPTRGSWPGVDNIRYYEFTDDGHLRLSLRNAEGRTTATLTWRKIEGRVGS